MVWFDVLKTLTDGRALPRRVLLWGPPGTGKSRWADCLGAVERITLHQAIDPSDLVGSWALVSRGPGQTETVLVEGPAARALRGGRALVLDEIDQAGPDVVCLLHALLDDPPGITLLTGERLSGAAGYCVIGTSNAAPDALPPALLDRFDLILHAGTPAPAAMAALTPQYRTAVERHYARMVESVQPWKRAVSFRSVKAVETLSMTLGLETAARLVFGDIEGADFAAAIASSEEEVP